MTTEPDAALLWARENAARYYTDEPETKAAILAGKRFIVECEENAAAFRAVWKQLAGLLAAGEAQQAELIRMAQHAQALEAEVARLRSAAILARDVFQHYGDLHAAKPDPEKAKRNYTMAAEMSAALGEQSMAMTITQADLRRIPGADKRKIGAGGRDAG